MLKDDWPTSVKHHGVVFDVTIDFGFRGDRMQPPDPPSVSDYSASDIDDIELAAKYWLSLTVIEDNVSDFELLCSRILKAAERDVCPDGLEESYFQSIE